MARNKMKRYDPQLLANTLRSYHTQLYDSSKKELSERLEETAKRHAVYQNPYSKLPVMRSYHIERRGLQQEMGNDKIENDETVNNEAEASAAVEVDRRTVDEIVDEIDDLSLDKVIDEALVDNDVQVLQGMISQFKNPFLYIRELVQNSLDAQAQQIDISVGRDETTGRAAITVRDDGCGMDRETIETYFLNLFNSSKELDRSTIGRFGVGIVSIFTQKPERILVETAQRDGNPYKLLLGEVERGAPTKIFTPKRPSLDQGTQLTLYVPLDEEELETVTERLHEELRNSCAYATTPIRFNGERINREFTIAAPVTHRFGGRGITGILGLTESGFAKIMNHRLVIKQVDAFTEKTAGLGLLLDSRHIDYNISRSDIQENVYYKKLQRTADRAIQGLRVEAFRWLEQDETTRESSPDKLEKMDGERRRVWEFAGRYMVAAGERAQPGRLSFRPRKSRARKLLKSLDDEILDAHIFDDYRSERVSIRQVLRAISEHGSVYLGRDSHLAHEAQNAGLLVLRQYAYTEAKGLMGTMGTADVDTTHNPVIRLLGQLGPVKYLDRAFSASEEISQAGLSEEEREFLEELNTELRGIKPLYRSIERCVFGNFRTTPSRYFSWHRTNKPEKPKLYVSKHEGTISSYEKGYGRRTLGDKQSLGHWVRQTLFASDTMLLNRQHEEIQQMLTSTGSERTERIYGLLMTLATEKSRGNKQLVPAVAAAYRRRT